MKFLKAVHWLIQDFSKGEGGGACYCKVVGLSSFTLNNISLLSFRKGELKVTFTSPFQLKRSPL